MNPVTPAGAQYLGGFPIIMLMFAFAGSLLAVTLFFREKLDSAARIDTPTSVARTMLEALLTLVIGFIFSTILTPVGAEYFGLAVGAKFNALAAALGFIGVPGLLAARGVLLAIMEKFRGKFSDEK